jgi:hypothetical protein
MGRKRGHQTPDDAQADKVCVACGRRIEWRKKWERDWGSIRFCSAACRRHRISPDDEALEAMIVQQLDERARGATICPSDVARAVSPEDWNRLMEPTRRAARRLVAKGFVEITQKGRAVDPSDFSGPIRIRRVDRM